MESADRLRMSGTVGPATLRDVPVYLSSYCNGDSGCKGRN